MDDTTKLEHILSAYARPIFLSITKPDENEDIVIVISVIAFKTMSIGERISYTFGLINKHCPDILSRRLVVIQAYTPDEMQKLLDKIFLPELFDYDEH